MLSSSKQSACPVCLCVKFAYQARRPTRAAREEIRDMDRNREIDLSENVKSECDDKSDMLLHAGCVTMMQMALSLAEEDNGNGPIKVSKTTYTHIASPVCHDAGGPIEGE